MSTTEQEESVTKIRKTGKQLYTCGWKTLMFFYSGSGDSCDQIEFSLENAEDIVAISTVSAEDLPDDFDAQELAENFLTLLPAGFENNEGGSGQIIMDTATGRITVSHEEYVIHTSSSSWDIK